MLRSSHTGHYVDKRGRKLQGDFDFDKNGKPIIKKNAKGEWVDKNGNPLPNEFDIDSDGNPILVHVPSTAMVDRRGTEVTSRGYRLDKDGNIIDNQGRKKFDKSQLT